MGRMIYAAIASLDGYVADADGTFDWAVPDADVHRTVNDIERSVGTALYGRRMYEVLVAWETLDTTGEPDYTVDFAEIWRATDKVVYSRTLEAVASARTRIEREFDPEAVRRMKSERDEDLSIGGPGLAAEALRAGLAAEIHLFLSPVIVGGGTRALPDGVRIGLELLDERRFANGVVHAHYRVARYSNGAPASHRAPARTQRRHAVGHGGHRMLARWRIRTLSASCVTRRPRSCAT